MVGSVEGVEDATSEEAEVDEAAAGVQEGGRSDEKGEKDDGEPVQKWGVRARWVEVRA